MQFQAVDLLIFLGKTVDKIVEGVIAPGCTITRAVADSLEDPL